MLDVCTPSPIKHRILGDGRFVISQIEISRSTKEPHQTLIIMEKSFITSMPGRNYWRNWRRRFRNDGLRRVLPDDDVQLIQSCQIQYLVSSQNCTMSSSSALREIQEGRATVNPIFTVVISLRAVVSYCVCHCHSRLIVWSHVRDPTLALDYIQ